MEIDKGAESVVVPENGDSGLASGRYRYWEHLEHKTAHPPFLRMARTWGGDDGALHTEWFHGAGDEWVRSHVPGEVRELKAQPITAQEAEQLRRTMRGHRS